MGSRAPLSRHDEPQLYLRSNAHGPRLPFASPVVDDQRSFRSANSGDTYQTYNPFASPTPSQTPTAGDESDTSGLDEFHLERYSQDTKNDPSRHHTTTREVGSGRGQGEAPDKKIRPGLNIITDFPKGSRSQTDGVLVEGVRAGRPEIGHRSRTSIKSSKVEHGWQPSETPPTQVGAFIRIGDITGPKQKKTMARKVAGNAKQPEQAANDGLWPKLRRRKESRSGEDRSLPALNTHVPPTTAQQAYAVSPAARSIVIGISVPQDEVDAHQPRGDDSALSMVTPATPSIVVTPADPHFPSTTSQPFSARQQRRPVSSVYSTMTGYGRNTADDEDVPPVPDIGIMHRPTNQETKPTCQDEANLTNRRDSTDSYDTIIDDDYERRPTRARPSSESQENILSPVEGRTRPESKGWWNLMLSPMLSRAHTLKQKISPTTPPVPKTHPAFTPKDSRSRAMEEEVSPETPRRLGLAIGPVPENEKGRHCHNPAATSMPEAGKGSSALDPGAVPSTMYAAGGRGLAAEYYQACAIDERGAGPYFECLNHDCAQRLPILGFCPMERDIGTDVATPVQPGHGRFMSNSSTVDDGPTFFSPNVRKADIAPVGRARALEAGSNKADPISKEPTAAEDVSQSRGDLKPPKRPTTPPAYSPPRSGPTVPKLVSVRIANHQPTVASPGPISPEFERRLASRDAVPMSEVLVSRQRFITSETSYPDQPRRDEVGPVTLADIDKPKEKATKAEKRYQRNEEGEATKKGRRCLPKNGCFGRGAAGGNKKKKWYIGIGIILLLIIIACLVVATHFTRHGDATPIQAEWLNLTGFPPMPTGISTVIRPDVVLEDTSCVQTKSLWSCSVPKEDQASIAPNDADQPNFRFEIRFRNGTLPANETEPLRRYARWALEKRTSDDPFTHSLYTPTPAAPSIAEQIFLGNTTDNITAPLFEGEDTPFYLTFIAAFPILPSSFNVTASSKVRRSGLTGSIPAPNVFTNGTAQPAVLTPLPVSQPIRLYNRGEPDEHYGFYNYFDRSIFVALPSPYNGSDPNTISAADNDTSNQDGGASREQSAGGAVCTWSQTRFIVKIFTNLGFPGVVSPTPAPTAADGVIVDTRTNSAIEFTPPGSFPYPISISLDRHGGDVDKKGVYCYGIDNNGDVIPSDNGLIAETRGSGGTAINPAPGLVATDPSNGGFDSNLGGADGGTGGCGCGWQNWAGDGVRPDGT